MDNKQTKWDFSLLLNEDSLKGMEKEKKLVEKQVNSFVEKWKEEDFLKSDSVLKEALDDYEDLMANYGTSGRIGYYYFLKKSLNQSDSNLQAKSKKIEEFSKVIANKLRFFELKIAKTGKQKQGEFLSSDKLSDYKNFLKSNFREGEYRLSEKEEEILSLKSGPAYSNWVEMVNRFLSEETREVLNSEGEKEEKSFSEIVSLVKDKDKEVRDVAAEAFNDILKSNVDVAEVELNSVLEDKKINDKLRGFESPEKARYIDDDIKEETVNTLVEVVTDNFNLSRRYYKLKAKLLGVDKLKYHERNVSYGSLDQEYGFEEAKELTSKVLSNLDPEFKDIFEDFIEGGHVDAFPKEGKRGGAFCIHNLITQPVYILLNYTGDLEDVLTLIHEAGHGINNELMRRRQNSLNFGVSTFTAEVASTFFEDFVTQEIAGQSDDQLRLSIIMNKLDRDISTIYRQIAATNFERQLHDKFRKKGYLPKDEIGKLFKRHMEAYMGDYVEQSEGSENWWVYWSHFRRFFYNYSYAGGLLISKSLQRRVKENPSFIGEVKRFLETGTSKPPKEIFKEMDIDIRGVDFWIQGIEETKSLIKEAEELAF